MAELTLDDFIERALKRIVGILLNYNIAEGQKSTLEMLENASSAQKYQYIKMMIAPLGADRFIQYRQEEAGVILETDDYETIKKIVIKLIEVV